MSTAIDHTGVALLDDHVSVTCELGVPVRYDVTSYAGWASFLVEQASWGESDQSIDWLSVLVDDVNDRLFITGFLCLLGKVFELARMPVFDSIMVVSGQLIDRNERKYRLQIQIPAVHHIQHKAYWHAVNLSIDLSGWIANNAPTSVNRDKAWKVMVNEVISPLQAMIPGSKSTMPVLRVAHRLGIPFFHLGLGAYQLGWGSKARRMSGSIVGSDSQIGSRLTQNKVITANILRAAGLPAPHHMAANTEQGALVAAAEIGFPVVVKPIDTDRGVGVTVDVVDTKTLIKAFTAAQEHTESKQVIVERQVPGVCHRLFVAHGELLYAVKRMPMGVFGDGQRTVAQLVQDHRLAESARPPWSRSEIQPIDELAIEALHQIALTPDSIPSDRQFVPLRRIESTQWGGIDEDVTKIVQPDNILAALQATEMFGLQVAGVDIISLDISQPWHVNEAIINEVNFAPLFGGAEISRSYIPAFFAQFIDSDGKIPIGVFQTKQQALEFQRQQSIQGKRCYLTWIDKTVDSTGVDIVMPFTQLAKRVRALVLRTDVDAIAVVRDSGPRAAGPQK